MPRFDVTSLGEALLRLSVPAGIRLEMAGRFDVNPAGAEANVMGALARLGRRTAWVSALPISPPGRLVANRLRTAGVDLSGVCWREEGRLGVYYVEFSGPPRGIEVVYDRADSCFAHLSPDEIDWTSLLDARLLHLTGITPALSPSCLELTTTAIAKARAAGVPMSFDINFRGKLWDECTAAAVLADLARGSDLLFCSLADARRVFGITGEPEEVVRRLAERLQPRQMVVSIGDQGMIGWDGVAILRQPAYPAQVIDRIGAGDALAAGVIHGWLDGDFGRGLRVGAALAALAISQHSDMVITTPAEVEGLLAAAGREIAR